MKPKHAEWPKRRRVDAEMTLQQTPPSLFRLNRSFFEADTAATMRANTTFTRAY